MRAGEADYQVYYDTMFMYHFSAREFFVYLSKIKLHSNHNIFLYQVYFKLLPQISNRM